MHQQDVPSFAVARVHEALQENGCPLGGPGLDLARTVPVVPQLQPPDIPRLEPCLQGMSDAIGWFRDTQEFCEPPVAIFDAALSKHRNALHGRSAQHVELVGALLEVLQTRFQRGHVSDLAPQPLRIAEVRLHFPQPTWFHLQHHRLPYPCIDEPLLHRRSRTQVPHRFSL